MNKLKTLPLLLSILLLAPRALAENWLEVTSTENGVFYLDSDSVSRTSEDEATLRYSVKFQNTNARRLLDGTPDWYVLRYTSGNCDSGDSGWYLITPTVYLPGGKNPSVTAGEVLGVPSILSGLLAGKPPGAGEQQLRERFGEADFDLPPDIEHKLLRAACRAQQKQDASQSDELAPLESAGDGHVVSVLEVGADGEPESDTGELDIEGLDHAGEKETRRVSLDAGREGQDDLLDRGIGQSRQQLLDFQVFRVNPFQW